MKNELKKAKKPKFPRWIPLNLYQNCFGEGQSKHLGICFRGVFYCITHSEGNGVLVPEMYLKMKNISPKNEYFKRCTVKPTKLHSTKMYIREDFIVKAILTSVLNKLNKQK